MNVLDTRKGQQWEFADEFSRTSKTLINNYLTCFWSEIWINTQNKKQTILKNETQCRSFFAMQQRERNNLLAERTGKRRQRKELTLVFGYKDNL